MYLYARENLVFQDVRESPVEWGAFEGTFACEDVGDYKIENTFSQNIKIHGYTRRAHVLCDVKKCIL